jgi:hypothetical protein
MASRSRRGALLTSTASSASAQNYSFDARRIALGGAGGTPNVASKLVERQRRYKSVLIPVGLVKVLSNIHVYYPNRDDFDLSRAVEFATSPLHFVFGRNEDITARSFFRDMIKAQLQSDLNAYREGGFDTPLVTSAEGLIALTWGHTFMLQESERSFQGIYVGAGPYLAAQAYADFDAEFEKLLNSPTDRYVRSASMGIGGERQTSWLSISPDRIARASRYSHRTARVPAAMASMSWRITIICRGFASTSSMRTCNWTPTRMVSFCPTHPKCPSDSGGTRRQRASVWPWISEWPLSSTAGTSAPV